MSVTRFSSLFSLAPPERTFRHPGSIGTLAHSRGGGKKCRMKEARRRRGGLHSETQEVSEEKFRLRERRREKHIAKSNARAEEKKFLVIFQEGKSWRWRLEAAWDNGCCFAKRTFTSFASSILPTFFNLTYKFYSALLKESTTATNFWQYT